MKINVLSPTKFIILNLQTIASVSRMEILCHFWRITAYRLSSECLCPFKIPMVNLILYSIVLRGRAFRRGLSPEGFTLLNGISALTKEAQGACCLLPSLEGTARGHCLCTQGHHQKPTLP
jgi:hypothetical protein